MSKDKTYKVIAIIGPTASGKSGLAIQLAKEFNGEIVNADSRQIYKYMDIGTAKDSDDDPNDELYTVDGIVHHLIDFVDPKRNFSVAEFQKLAYEKIQNITERGKLPFLVGGTGLWVDAVCKGFVFPKSEQQRSLRDKLADKTADELFDILYEINPNRLEKLNKSDLLNPVRLIRAIEIEMGKQDPNNSTSSDSKELQIESLYLSPKTNIEQLEQRIYARVDKMFEAGLIDENKRLLEMGYTYDLPSMSGIGYKEFEGYFEGKRNLNEVKEEIKLRTRQYAKRQITWFKKNETIQYVNPDEAINLISLFLK